MILFVFSERLKKSRDMRSFLIKTFFSFPFRYKLFVDSKPEGQQILSGAVAADRSVRTVYIGNTPGLQPAAFFNGLMKEMRYYRSTYYTQFAAKGKEMSMKQKIVKYFFNSIEKITFLSRE